MPGILVRILKALFLNLVIPLGNIPYLSLITNNPMKTFQNQTNQNLNMFYDPQTYVPNDSWKTEPMCVTFETLLLCCFLSDQTASYSGHRGPVMGALVDQFKNLRRTTCNKH